MEDHLIDEIGSPEEQSNRENIRFAKSYGVGIDTQRGFIQVYVPGKISDPVINVSGS